MSCFTPETIKLGHKIDELTKVSSEVSAAAANVIAHSNGSEDEAVKIMSEQTDRITGDLHNLLVALEEIGGKNHS